MRFGLIIGILGAVGLILLTALTGNSDAIDPWNIQDSAAIPAGDLTSSPIGQTFVSHAARLHSIQVRWIVSDDFQATPDSRILLHVRRTVSDAVDVAIASVPLREVQNNGFAKFDFAPLRDSRNQSYYFFFDASQVRIERGSLSLWASADDAYADGRMYWGGIPTESDLVFRTYYEPDAPMLLAAAERVFGEYGLATLAALAVFLVPGLLLSFLWSGSASFRSVEAIGLASGLGLAAISAGAILWLWLGFAHGLTLLLAVVFLLGAARTLAFQKPAPPGSSSIGQKQETPVVSLVLGILVLLSIGLGLVQIRDMSVPLWVDSLTHAAYIKSIVSLGRLPSDHFYHLGYHVIVALLARLTGVSIPQAMLVVGQLLLTQAGFSILLLSRRLSGSTTAAFASAISVWFLSPTPAYFITWGRYPLLLGVALLPLALFFAIELIEEPGLEWRPVFSAAITLVGLAFSQIRLTAFYLAFVLIYLAYVFFRDQHARHRSTLVRVGLVVGGGALFAGLWLGVLFVHGVTWRDILALNAGAPSIDLSTASVVVLTHHGPELWLLALLGVGVGFCRRSKVAWIAVGWYILLALIAVLPQDYLPLSLVVLMGALPAALVIGDGVQQFCDRFAFSSDLNSFGIRTAIVAATVVAIVLIGARDMVSIVNPATVLFSPADAQAMAIAQAHLPGDAKFLVNSFSWVGSDYVPSDGGGWIPYLTGHPITYLDSPLASGATPETIARWVESQNIVYVYLGRRAGVLSKAEFSSQPGRYRLIYDREGVQIFRVRKAEALSSAPFVVGGGRRHAVDSSDSRRRPPQR